MQEIKTPAKMKSSVMRGAFYWNQSARAEFLQLIAE
jgi:GTP cyclohydrolase I